MPNIKVRKKICTQKIRKLVCSSFFLYTVLWIRIQFASYMFFLVFLNHWSDPKKRLSGTDNKRDIKKSTAVKLISAIMYALSRENSVRTRIRIAILYSVKIRISKESDPDPQFPNADPPHCAEWRLLGNAEYAQQLELELEPIMLQERTVWARIILSGP